MKGVWKYLKSDSWAMNEHKEKVQNKLQKKEL